MKKIFLLSVFLLPFVAQATTTIKPIEDINGLAERATSIGNLVIVLTISLAVVWMIVGIFRYLVAGGEDDRKKGGETILYGVLGLVAIFSIWGLVALVTGTFKFANNQRPGFENLNLPKPSQRINYDQFKTKDMIDASGKFGTTFNNQI